MTDPVNDQISKNKAKTIDDEIEAAEEKVRRLKEKKKEAEVRERERNQRALLDLLKSEKLEFVPIEHWIAQIEPIKALLAKDLPKAAIGKKGSKAESQSDAKSPNEAELTTQS